MEARGDTHVDLHHTVEDVGIAFGEALAAALEERRGIVRFAHAYAPLDEALRDAALASGVSAELYDEVVVPERLTRPGAAGTAAAPGSGAGRSATGAGGPGAGGAPAGSS